MNNMWTTLRPHISYSCGLPLTRLDDGRLGTVIGALVGNAATVLRWRT